MRTRTTAATVTAALPLCGPAGEHSGGWRRRASGRVEVEAADGAAVRGKGEEGRQGEKAKEGGPEGAKAKEEESGGGRRQGGGGGGMRARFPCSQPAEHPCESPVRAPLADALGCFSCFVRTARETTAGKRVRRKESERTRRQGSCTPGRGEEPTTLKSFSGYVMRKFAGRGRKGD